MDPNNEITERLGKWEYSISLFNMKKDEFKDFTAPLDHYLLSFLKKFFAETYHSSLTHVVTAIANSEKDPKFRPFVAYILFQAENIEPLIQQKLLTFRESQAMVAIDSARAKSDYLLYLLLGDMNENMLTYFDNLNKEITLIEKIVRASDKQKKFKKLIYDIFKQARESDDPTFKQFIVVSGLCLEPEYRQRFLPTKVDQDHPIRVNPHRFYWFITNILPKKMKRLRAGNFTGLMEFMDDIRPDYAMIV